MTRTLSTILVAALALAHAGCSADNPPSPQAKVLRGHISTLQSPHYVGDAPEQVSAPELCGDCLVTLRNIYRGGVATTAVIDDHGAELCHVVLADSYAKVDDCGLFDATDDSDQPR